MGDLRDSGPRLPTGVLPEGGLDPAHLVPSQRVSVVAEWVQAFPEEFLGKARGLFDDPSALVRAAVLDALADAAILLERPDLGRTCGDLLAEGLRDSSAVVRRRAAETWRLLRLAEREYGAGARERGGPLGIRPGGRARDVE